MASSPSAGVAPWDGWAVGTWRRHHESSDAHDDAAGLLGSASLQIMDTLAPTASANIA